MAHIRFTKGKSVREVKAGYSWTVLFFSFFPFLFRGMYGHALAIFFANFITFGLAGIIMSFFANKMTANWLQEKGYVTNDNLPDGW